MVYFKCIVMRGGVYNEILPEPLKSIFEINLQILYKKYKKCNVLKFLLRPFRFLEWWKCFANIIF